MFGAEPSRFFPSAADASADGLIGLGGKMTVELLLDAYAHGIFPWPLNERLAAWWSPDPRAVIELDHLYVSRRLARRCRSGAMRLACDTRFAEVLEGCATAQDRRGATWITADIRRAYEELHELGHAHSIEVFIGDELVGGLYGVALGAMFAAESMYYRVRDASKVAMVGLVGHLRKCGFTLLDIQQLTPHTARMGATVIPRDAFLARVASAVDQPVAFDTAIAASPATYLPTHQQINIS